MTEYVGKELELFASAVNWKAYLYEEIRAYLGSRVVEVGAGVGTTTKALCRETPEMWICIEPDPFLSNQVEQLIREGKLPQTCSVVTGDIHTLSGSLRSEVDSVLYIDVLEHIEDDRNELDAAARLLRAGGYIVVLAPAHQWLYTPFDAAIGHHRRYDKSSLVKVFPSGGHITAAKYLDSCGLFASGGNALLLRSSTPAPTQIAFWDSYLVPLSKRLDPLLHNKLGKSVLCVWQKDAK